MRQKVVLVLSGEFSVSFKTQVQQDHPASSPRSRAHWNAPKSPLTPAVSAVAGNRCRGNKGETEGSDESQYRYSGRNFHPHIVSKPSVVMSRGTAWTRLMHRAAEKSGGSGEGIGSQRIRVGFSSLQFHFAITGWDVSPVHEHCSKAIIKIRFWEQAS